MKKMISVLGVVAGMVLFVGCSNESKKTDAEMIKESYASAISGNSEYTIDVVAGPMREELKSKKVESDKLILRKVELSTVLRGEQCKMDVSKVSGDWATIYIACGGFMNGESYMKKENGVWKVPVRE